MVDEVKNISIKIDVFSQHTTLLPLLGKKQAFPDLISISTPKKLSGSASVISRAARPVTPPSVITRRNGLRSTNKSVSSSSWTVQSTRHGLENPRRAPRAPRRQRCAHQSAHVQARAQPQVLQGEHDRRVLEAEVRRRPRLRLQPRLQRGSLRLLQRAVLRPRRDRKPPTEVQHPLRHWLRQPVGPLQGMPLHQPRLRLPQQVRLLRLQHLHQHQRALQDPVR
uniref:Uncharacterized protein n=1 Tax=Steinernema glaseri TaxID=37863 RepID=A0A1I7ZBM8_9BILA